MDEKASKEPQEEQSATVEELHKVNIFLIVLSFLYPN
jgi:hypothetical protein